MEKMKSIQAMVQMHKEIDGKYYSLNAEVEDCISSLFMCGKGGMVLYRSDRLCAF